MVAPAVGGAPAPPAPPLASPLPAGMSIPENFTIYHGDNLFTNGPEGVQRNLASRVVCKQLLGPQYMSFQQVQRWIYEMFKVDEATHKLVLRHIVPVKPKNQTRPYNMVVDIVGLDSWRAFLDVSLRLGVSLVLYVQWQAKTAPGPVYQGAIGDKNSATSVLAPAPALATAPAAASKEPTVAGKQGGSWPSCRKHGKPCSIETSWDREDPGRRFYCCPLSEDPARDCGFTQWLDEAFPEKATMYINSLMSSKECLEQKVENLQQELNELRRRYVTSSSQDSHGAPRTGKKVKHAHTKPAE